MGIRDNIKDAEIVDDANPYLKDVSKGLELCAKIISVGDMKYQESLEHFDDYLNQFIELSSNDTNDMGIKTYQSLCNIKKDLENILSFPQLENNYTVAVGGSFSSGKSTFLNNVLGLKNILPRDTNPTTSIPAYIVSSDKEAFYALNNFNNIIQLDKDAIGAISHAFYKKYKLSFSHTVKLLLIEQNNLKYKNIVFLDTPGYSKADNNTDKNIAKEHLRGADFLIWLIDSQAPISHGDINFIKKLNLTQPILVVLNKADKRNIKDIKILIEKTKENLITADISFYDVVGFSSLKNKEYSPTTTIIHTYLNTIASNTTGTKTLKHLKNVFKQYQDYYNAKKQEYKIYTGVLNKILMLSSKSNEYEKKIEELYQKISKQRKSIINFSTEFTEFQTELGGLVGEMLQNSGINIIKYIDEEIFDHDYYDNVFRNKKREFRFDASLFLEDENELFIFKNLLEVDAEVNKIGSIAVYISIDNITNDLIISKKQIKKETKMEAEEIFEEGQKVKVQIIDTKQCVVIVNNMHKLILLKNTHQPQLYAKKRPKKEVRDIMCDTSLHIELSYFTDTPDEQMYFKLGEEYIKLKSIHSNITGLDMTAYIDKETMFSGALPISIKNRNIHGIYNKEEVEQDLDNTHAQSAKLVEEYLDVTKKRLEFVDDIRETILNDEQARLEVQKAILKLTDAVNKSEISKSIKDYKEMVKGDTTLVSDLLKIFKSVI